MRKLRVYLAGPISAGNQFENVANGIKVGQEIWNMGAIPFIPHLSALASIAIPGGMSYENWMEYDFAWLETCDGLFRMPGVSPGADLEVAHAGSLGIPVFELLDDLEGFIGMYRDSQRDEIGQQLQEAFA